MKKRVIFFEVLLVILFFGLVGGVITGEVITGDAVEQEVNASITITGAAPALTLINPENKTYLTNVSILLNFTVSGERSVWYNLDGGSNITITSFLYFNATSGAHILYLFANNSDGDETIVNVSFSLNDTLLVIIMDEYLGRGETVDLTRFAFEDLQSLGGIILERVDEGKISFQEDINVSNDDDPDDRVVDLDLNINISTNRIELNSTGLPNFNVSAILILRGLNFSNPRILRNGVLCTSDICSINNYSGGNFSFNVTQFAIYSAEETPDNETSEPPAGGGGGGSGGAPSIYAGNFSLIPRFFQISLKQGESKEETLVLTNNGNKELTINLRVQSLVGNLVLSRDSVKLSPGESTEVFAIFSSEEDEEAQVITGTIVAESGSLIRRVNVLLEIVEREPLFDIETELKDSTLDRTQLLEVLIDIFNVGDDSSANVALEYFIKDFYDNEIKIGQEIVTVYGFANLERSFVLPEGLGLGEYVFYAKLTYKDSAAISSNPFSLGEFAFSPKSFFGITIIIIIIIFAVLIFAILRRMYKKRLGRLN
jgi:hypothetical protein